jgi:hypothetical protein
MALLLVAAGVVAACFAIPVGYLLLRGDDLFSIALAWIGGGSGAQSGIAANLATLAAQLTGFGAPIWSIALVAGLALLLALRRRDGGILLLAVGVPLASIVVLGREVLPRHFVVALPALLILGGAGIGVAVDRWRQSAAQRRIALAGVSLLLAIGFAPFALQAYTAPDQLRVPDAVRTQYFSEHSSGYGLREAVRALGETISDDSLIIASMTADSCRRANFYAVAGLSLVCADAPGLGEVRVALEVSTVAYVLVESATGAHFPQDADALDAQAEQIAVYPRPGADGQPVTLWKLTLRPSEPPSS